MITASIVTYEHHLLDIEPVLRSLLASPVDRVYIVDHSEQLADLQSELGEFEHRVIAGENRLRQKANQGFCIEYLRHPNRGYGAGHNVALAKAMEAGAQYHLVVNPDVWFGPEVIPALVEYMEGHADVAHLMPKVLYPNGKIQRLAHLLPTPLDMFCRMCLPYCLFKRRNDRFEVMDSRFEMTLNLPFLSGCFMFLRVSALRQVGGFDERYFLYAEDIDLTRRIHEHYQTVFYPEVQIYHRFSRASRHSVKLMWVHLFSLVKYFNKWGWWHDAQRTVWNRQVAEAIAHYPCIQTKP